MFSPKTPKNQLPDKTLYTVHNIIDHNNNDRKWLDTENYEGDYIVVSIDPGEINLAIRVEKRNHDASSVETLSFNKYNLHAYGSDEFLYHHIQNIDTLIDNVDMSKVNELYKDLTSVLDHMYGKNMGRRSRVYDWNTLLDEIKFEDFICLNNPNRMSNIMDDDNTIKIKEDQNIIKILCIRYHVHKYLLMMKQYKTIASICKYLEKTTENHLKKMGLKITEIRTSLKLLDSIFDKKNNRKLTKSSFIYDDVNDILDHHLEYLFSSHMIIVERQREINYKMIRMSQHIITYCLLKLTSSLNNPLIYEIASTLKTKALKAPPNLTPKQVKNWSVELGQLILKYRGDTQSLEVIEKASKSKKDDYCDVVVQIEALFKYIGLATTFDKMNVQSQSSFSLSADIPVPNTDNMNNTYVDLSYF
jgi:hypothetical protein